jgi:hypothetical protein
MSMPDRFRAGVYAASDSFAMLCGHPGLLVYLGIAALVYFFIQLLAYNVPMLGFAGDGLTVFIGMRGLQYSLLELSQWLYWGCLIVLTFAYVFIVTFLNVCLIRHTLAIIYDDMDKATVSVALRRSAMSVSRIAAWSVLFTCISLALSIIAISTYLGTVAFSLGLVFVVVAVACWSLVTFFVLPIIAVHDIGIWRALQQSFGILKTLIVEVVGAQAWMALIGVLIFIPLSIMLGVLSRGSGAGSRILSFMVTLLTIFFAYAILSAQTILKTRLYYRYVQLREELDFVSRRHV